MTDSASRDELILITGGSGRLGTQIVKRLTAQGRNLRVLTRDLARAAHLYGPLVEVVQGDVRDTDAVEHAVRGVSSIVSAIHGFAGTRGSTPQTVDRQGNLHLIEAAQHQGVQKFVLMSIQGAVPNHPLELFRMKAAAEQQLKASSLQWFIIRPTAFMETWARLAAEPLLLSGKTRVFGQGNNPINFVSVDDVAHLVDLLLTKSNAAGTTVEIGGPENLTMRQFVELFATGIGKQGTIRSVPLPVMRLMTVLLRLTSRALASQIQAGIYMDTADMTFDPTETLRCFPTLRLTHWAEVVGRDYNHQAGRTVKG